MSDTLFNLTTVVEASGPVVHVQGAVDLATAPMLLHELLALTDRGFSDLTIDLSGLVFMDASGLGALAVALRGVQRAGGQLTLRSPPAMVTSILGITGLGQLVRTQQDGHITERRSMSGLGKEKEAGDRSAGVQLRDVDVNADLRRASSLPAGDAVVDAALRLVTTLAVATVVGADGASVSLARHGQLRTVAATNETVARMDAHQYATDEGPCVAASRAGHWFHIEALSAENRWPDFVPRARDEGIASILSTPLIALHRPIGALNIYSNREGAFGPEQQELAALFASQASGILEDAGIAASDDEVAGRLLRALEAREVIAQAQGVVMARQNLTPGDAAGVLQREARQREVTVRVAAQDVVASTQLPTTEGNAHA